MRVENSYQAQSHRSRHPLKVEGDEAAPSNLSFDYL
jgi:hypothetical protein